MFRPLKKLIEDIIVELSLPYGGNYYPKKKNSLKFRLTLRKFGQ